jgi:putative tryptophan/tyrosine transport system substrate-binding protein
MRRREFIAGLGSAVAWPMVGRAQQRTLPTIGFLYIGEPKADWMAAFRQGLSETGFVEGRDVTIEYRFAKNQRGLLTEFATDLVRRRVAVVATSSLEAALAIKAATATIPIVFRTGADPVQYGLVASLNKPGGNITGINDIGLDLGAKRLGLLHTLLPAATRFGILIDPTLTNTDSEIKDAREAALSIGASIEIVRASTNGEIDEAFANLIQKGVNALMVAPEPLFTTRRVQIAHLATYHRLPAIYHQRDATEIGGLMSYGTNFAELYRLEGVYAGRILKGDKPADLPVMRPIKFEFIINLQTAKILGIEVPSALLAIADEVIE